MGINFSRQTCAVISAGHSYTANFIHELYRDCLINSFKGERRNKKSNQHGANLPVAPFCANIIAMPWMELMDEFDRLVVSGEYSNISFYREIKNTLVNEAIALQKEGV